MTKEETLSNLKAYLDGDIAVGNIIPLRSVLESAIKYLSKPSLPSNLDEAAEEYEHNLDYYECISQWPSVAFKAGAEWMAGQGESVTATVGKYNDSKILSYDQEFAPVVQRLNYGDKVVVQIRKK